VGIAEISRFSWRRSNYLAKAIQSVQYQEGISQPGGIINVPNFLSVCASLGASVANPMRAIRVFCVAEPVPGTSCQSIAISIGVLSSDLRSSIRLLKANSRTTKNKLT